MTLKSLAAAACLSLVSATASLAAPVNFEFSFTDGINTITGLIEGLDSDGLNQQATRVTAVGTINSYIFDGNTIENSFDVTNSIIDPLTVSFVRDSTRDPINDLQLGAISFQDGTGFLNEAQFVPGMGVTGNISTSTDPTIVDVGQVIFTAVAPSPVPLPAGGLLLLSGLVGVAGFRRRKNSAVFRCKLEGNVLKSATW